MVEGVGQSSRRLASLDALRGLTIAAMLLVNNPGSWSHIYWPLEHAAWNGWTFTDVVFPFFLFMVGVAMMFSFPKRLARGDSRRTLMGHVVARAAALMLLGWWGASWSRVLWTGQENDIWSILLRVGFVLGAVASVILLAGTDRRKVWMSVFAGGLMLFFAGALGSDWEDSLLTRLAGLRIPGVLVRIAWCYLIASALWFWMPTRKAMLGWIAGLLGFYFVFMLAVPIPGFGMPDLSMGFPTADTPVDQLFSNWAFYIDFNVFGDHTWSARQLRDASGTLIWSFDPEGLISTIPATCSVLFGILTGKWLTRQDRDDQQKLNGLFVAAGWLMLIGLVVSIWMPINKRIWTSSYTIFTAGMALATLGILYHAIDMKGWTKWAYPMVAYGRNAIFAFVASGMMATSLALVGVGDGSLKGWLYGVMPGSPKMASFLFGISFVTAWALIVWWLDRKKWYFKV
ncbi:MAG: acyltransferase family protein [Rhodothermales bacterium]